ncbi:MAG: S41 family peptidase, partial [Pseudomonadales bacterium]
HDLYLWYREVEDRDPALFETADYFDLLKTEAITPSGRPKDNFHGSLDTAAYQKLSNEGVSVGYGVIWTLPAASPPRDIRVALVEPGSPAASTTIALERGLRVIEIDGIDAVNDGSEEAPELLNAALYPDTPGTAHTFVFEDAESGEQRTVVLTAESVTYDPVPMSRVIDTPTGAVGYLLFTDHIATAERELLEAVTGLDDAGISDLVLDLRYNGGGFLDIASELAYMIAGPNRTRDRAFETQRFNDQHTTRNPVTGEVLRPLPFRSTTTGFSVPSGRALPTLALPRVFVLTGSETCSASESIMNALAGINVEVVQIGGTTCGKPYGFYPEDNCGTTYFSIQFQGLNDAGFGDYADGFSPVEGTATTSAELPGCAVADDFLNSLGATSEARLAAALEYRRSRSCPAVTVAPLALARARIGPSSTLRPPPWRQLRVASRAADNSVAEQ